MWRYQSQIHMQGPRQLSTWCILQMNSQIYVIVEVVQSKKKNVNKNYQNKNELKNRIVYKTNTRKKLFKAKTKN